MRTITASELIAGNLAAFTASVGGGSHIVNVAHVDQSDRCPIVTIIDSIGRVFHLDYDAPVVLHDAEAK